jgi:hypothetical protein
VATPVKPDHAPLKFTADAVDEDNAAVLALLAATFTSAVFTVSARLFVWVTKLIRAATQAYAFVTKVAWPVVRFGVSGSASMGISSPFYL